jgi:hypothetical protein
MNVLSQNTLDFTGKYIYNSKENISIELNIFELKSDTTQLAFSMQYIFDKSLYNLGIELFPTGRFDDNYNEEFNFFIIKKNKLILDSELIFTVSERVDIDMGKDIWRTYIENEKLKLIFHNNKTVSINFLNITKLLNEHFGKKYTPFDTVILTKKE